jgi:hypothetical protein
MLFLQRERELCLCVCERDRSAAASPATNFKNNMYSKFRGYCAPLSIQQGTLKDTLKFRVSASAATCRETLFVLYPAIKALRPDTCARDDHC